MLIGKNEQAKAPQGGGFGKLLALEIPLALFGHGTRNNFISASACEVQFRRWQNSGFDLENCQYLIVREKTMSSNYLHHCWLNLHTILLQNRISSPSASINIGGNGPATIIRTLSNVSYVSQGSRLIEDASYSSSELDHSSSCPVIEFEEITVILQIGQ